MNCWIIARTTLGDAMRKRVLLIFLLIALATLFLAMMLTYMTAREQRTTFLAMELIIILIFGALIALTTSIFLIPDEVEKRTIYSVLSKPVQRWEFFVGKFLGGALTTLVCLGMMSAVLLLVVFLMAMRPIDASIEEVIGLQQQTGLDVGEWFRRGFSDMLLVLRGVYVIFFQLVLLTAIATTLSLFVTPTVNFSLTAFIFIAGQVQFVLKAALERNELLPVQWLIGIFYYLTPHFQDFNIMGSIIHLHREIEVNHWLFAGTLSLYGIAYSAFVILLGVLVFDRKEV